jgi:hypothetical protein
MMVRALPLRTADNAIAIANRRAVNVYVFHLPISGFSYYAKRPEHRNPFPA